MNEPIKPARQRPALADDEIDLVDLARRLWRGKWLIAGLAITLGVIAGLGSLLIANTYRAEVLLAPASKDDQGAISGLVGQLGGLASLAGVNISGGGVDSKTLALETLQSRVFLAEFIRNHDLLVPLMATKGWDADSAQWIIDTDTYDPAAKKWVRDIKPPKQLEPSDWELYKELKDRVLAVNEDKKSGMVRLAVTLKSPEEAARWATLLVGDINSYMRARDIEDARKSIEYLREQLQKTSITEMQQIFYRLIENQTQTMMLAQVRDEYAFRVVDPAVVPEEHAKPNRLLITLIAVFLGGVIGIAVQIVRSSDQG